MTTISFIIPTPPGCRPDRAIDAICAQDYPVECLEILHVEGHNPSRQRNLAAQQATGELLYFLDDDSLLQPQTLLEATTLYERNHARIVGGPALLRDGASFLEQCIAQTLSSPFASGIASNRYRQHGKVRTSGGEELILCNLLIQRALFLESGGFAEALYPNEENEFLKRMRRAEVRMYYSPNVLVKRPMRESLSAFVSQIFWYGNGRGQHIFEGFSVLDGAFLVPVGFLLYLIVLLLFPNWLLAIPLLVYLLLSGLCATKSAFADSTRWTAPVVFLLFPVLHCTYALGLLSARIVRGRARKSGDTITITTLLAFADPFAGEHRRRVNTSKG